MKFTLLQAKHFNMPLAAENTQNPSDVVVPIVTVISNERLPYHAKVIQITGIKCMYH